MKLIKWLAIPILGLILAGCVDSTARVEINKDKSADLSLEAAMDGDMYALAGPYIEKALKGTDYKLEQGENVIKVFKHYPSLEALSSIQDGSGESKISVDEKDSFFYTAYDVKASVDLQSQLSRYIGEVTSNTFIQSIILQKLDQSDLKLEVALPYKLFGSNNADEENGNTLSWDISTATETPVEFEVIVPKVKTIATTAGIVVVFIIGAVILIVKGKRKRK
ncbi:hypothetical protein [Peribacillus sp. NPDC097225]|uniref:hypothetical protein n=1 Tax=Peribacillus sp. NPDC097225 TaxID=3364400 RepID=UPI003803C7CE